MRFAFTEDQLAFRDAVRDLLERECPPAVVRDAWTNETGRTPTVWGHLAEMGVLGALAPPAAGGLGLSFLDLVLVLEETGYAALPEPVLEHAAVAIPLLPDPGPATTGTVTVTASFGKTQKCSPSTVAPPAAAPARRVFFNPSASVRTEARRTHASSACRCIVRYSRSGN